MSSLHASDYVPEAVQRVGEAGPHAQELDLMLRRIGRIHSGSIQVMAKAQSRNSRATNDAHGDHAISAKSERKEIPAAELLSFLKEAAGPPTWTEKDLANTLKISLSQAKEAAAILQLQGYIEQVGNTGKWRATEQGELVSGAKPPRFTPKSVDDALAALRDRIKAVNSDPGASYKITDAVAFGDFLRDAARVQAAEVGIRLVAKSDTGDMTSATEHAAELDFLKQLRGKAALLHVVPYEDWMSSRSHIRLL
jgi:hypothetical protein